MLTPRQFRALHSANPAICCDDCPGWCLSEGNDGVSRIERCDECWRGHNDAVADEDAAALPEAKWLSDAYGLELSA